LRIPVPALVSPELFAIVQEQLAENRQRQRAALAGARHLLQGLLVCKICGYALCGHASARRSGGYYRCLGGQGRRFVGGRRVCQAPPLRMADLDGAVWNDVEHLIDSYANGLLEKEEFEPRMRRAREQLARLQAEAKIQADRQAEQGELKLLVSRLQDFADHVKAGLQEMGWERRREVIRTLVKRIEVEEQSIRIIYRVNLPPFAKTPKGGLAQHCSNHQRGWRRP
jgi:site-specific DNA recombinase